MSKPLLVPRAFDPDCTRLGLGKIAIAASIRGSVAAGRRLYDFTRGAAYKYWYGAVDRPLPSVVIGHPAVRSRFALAAARLLSAYRSRRTRGRGPRASTARGGGVAASRYARAGRTTASK
jgi:hypothetical protein